MRGFHGWAICWRTLVVILLLIAAGPAQAGIAGLEEIGSGLGGPAFVTHAPGDNNRLFVAELNGNIKIIDLNTNTVTGTFLNIEDTDSANEGGLLGLAFHPNYSNEGMTGFGKFYVYVTVDNDLEEEISPFTSRIREYSVDPGNPNLADPDSAREVLNFVQPDDNHNGGWIGFNPQVTPGQPQYLYIASGDGGGSHDNDSGHSTLPDASGNAQDLTTNRLGKMLRIDVNVPDEMGAPPYLIPASNPFVGTAGDGEIWAYGLRNPYRDSFDRLTGDLWIGDVGQGQREEVDFQPANSPGGENYGWRFREGTFMTDGGVGGPDLPAYTDPIYDYGRGGGDFLGETVIGGYVYRGPDPDLQGMYIFGDADPGNDNVWLLDPPDPIGPVTAVDNINEELGTEFETFGRIVSFGEDNIGNLYIVDVFGAVYRIVTDNLIDGDYDGDGNVDTDDYLEWKAAYGTSDPAADGNGDGMVNAGDYPMWRNNLGNRAQDVVPGGGGGIGVPEPAAGVLVAQFIAIVLLHLRRHAKL